jgi:hypothetical protein
MAKPLLHEVLAARKIIKAKPSVMRRKMHIQSGEIHREHKLSSIRKFAKITICCGVASSEKFVIFLSCKTSRFEHAQM